MKNDLPEKYKDNFINKIRKFFKKILKVEKNEIKNDDINIEDSANNKFIEDLRISMSQDIMKKPVDYSRQNKKFLLDLAEHPEVLEKFSIEKLEVILNAYILENNKPKV